MLWPNELGDASARRFHFDYDSARQTSVDLCFAHSGFVALELKPEKVSRWSIAAEASREYGIFLI